MQYAGQPSAGAYPYTSPYYQPTYPQQPPAPAYGLSTPAPHTPYTQQYQHLQQQQQHQQHPQHASQRRATPYIPTMSMRQGQTPFNAFNSAAALPAPQPQHPHQQHPTHFPSVNPFPGVRPGSTAPPPGDAAGRTSRSSEGHGGGNPYPAQAQNGIPSGSGTGLRRKKHHHHHHHSQHQRNGSGSRPGHGGESSAENVAFPSMAGNGHANPNPNLNSRAGYFNTFPGTGTKDPGAPLKSALKKGSNPDLRRQQQMDYQRALQQQQLQEQMMMDSRERDAGGAAAVQRDKSHRGRERERDREKEMYRREQQQQQQQGGYNGRMMMPQPSPEDDGMGMGMGMREKGRSGGTIKRSAGGAKDPYAMAQQLPEGLVFDYHVYVSFQSSSTLMIENLSNEGVHEVRSRIVPLWTHGTVHVREGEDGKWRARFVGDPWGCRGKDSTMAMYLIQELFTLFSMRGFHYQSTILGSSSTPRLVFTAGTPDNNPHLLIGYTSRAGSRFTLSGPQDPIKDSVGSLVRGLVTHDHLEMYNYGRNSSMGFGRMGKPADVTEEWDEEQFLLHVEVSKTGFGVPEVDSTRFMTHCLKALKYLGYEFHATVPLGRKAIGLMGLMVGGEGARWRRELILFKRMGQGGEGWPG